MLNHKSIRSLSIIAIVALVVIVLGVLTVSAQNPDDNTMPWGRGMMGSGMMGRGHHMDDDDMWGRNGFMMGNDIMFDTIAEALNLESADLIDQLQSGKTLTEIATEQGIEPTALEAIILEAQQTHMNLMVEDGYMTQEQADAMLSYISENGMDHLTWMFSGNHRGHRGGW